MTDAALDSSQQPASDDGIDRVAERLRNVRGRHRSRKHTDAHEADPAEEKRRRGVKKRLLDHPLVAKGKAKLVDTEKALEKVLADLALPGEDGRPARFAFDTEFIGETSYHPKLCLVQVATPRIVALIDPLAEIDTGPLWELMVDGSIEKILHAGEQDLQPVARLTGKPPANVLDTQIAAGFCGLPYPASLAKLVEYVSAEVVDEGRNGGGLKLGKGFTFTQWDERPLSAKQLQYADDDVRWLPLVLDWIERQLDGDPDRRRWMEEECAARCVKAMSDHEEDPWERLKGYGGLDGRARPVARKLAIWRDKAAQEMNLPPRALVKDEVLIFMSRQPPKSREKIAEVKHFPRPLADRYGDAILSAVEEGKATQEETVGYVPYEPSLADKFAADAAWAELQHLAYQQDLDPNLIASRRDAEDLVRRVKQEKPIDKSPILQGWRGDAVGRKLLESL